MKRLKGRCKVNDDEWYTPYETAEKVAAFLANHLSLDTPILCSADILLDGTESTIPRAMREAGFKNVRVTRDFLRSEPGEVVVTNPPFSLLVPFRKFAKANNIKYCILARQAAMMKSWPISLLKDRFHDEYGRSVAASWQQNIVDTSVIDEGVSSIGNCLLCERKSCPKNDLTGKMTPGKNRPLYGFGNAVKLGISGFYCKGYTANGKNKFTRFFYPEE